jgi:error-prone DNA polymerase
VSGGYVPLWCRSNYSFLEGASTPEELVQAAAGLGLPALALTDRDGVYGIVRAHLEAKKQGVRLLVGSQLTMEDVSWVLLLAQDRRGYANLCRLISAGRLRCPKGSARLHWEELCASPEGLIALWAGGPGEVAGALREAFGDRLYGLLTRHREAEERDAESRLRREAARHGLPLVASTEVLYHTRERRKLQDVLTCIRHTCTLAQAGRRLRANDEHALKSAAEMAGLFRDLLAEDPRLLERSGEIAERCHFSLEELRYRYPSETLPDGRTSAQRLRALTLEGARRRYGQGPPEAVLRQLSRELQLIEELDYCGYFLTMWEIVEFCRRQGILCQGRGSAANSAVCYCLGITAVDPVRLQLLFERFISRERDEPPDIDLDIEHRRREEVIGFVYERYGRERAAMVANVVRFRLRSAVREVGKVLGFPATALDRVAKLLPMYGGRAELGPALRPGLRQAGLGLDNPLHRRLEELAAGLLEFPRHLSIHPGGFLLGAEPVAGIVPVENATMPGRTVIQWDKYDVEDMRLFKVDLLGLGALTHLDYCFRLLKEHRGVALSMATIPAADSQTFDLACRADTVGVFQIESRAQMAMLPRLKPRSFYDLVIEISIVRPGPIVGGMVHPYLRRRRGEEPVQYPHPSLVPVLRKTLGVPLFQEQVMRLAMVAADYSPGEADQLRRDMAAWRSSGRIGRHKDKLIRRMIAKGITREFAEAVYQQILGFGEYGFPESHAASFALIAYCTAWLKSHYPVEFTCALLNAWPMGFYAPSTIVEDARRHGMEVRPVDVLASAWECTLEPIGSLEGAPPFALRLGLRFVRGLGKEDFRRIEVARAGQGRDSGAGQGPSVEEFVCRSGINEQALASLAQSGAFGCFGVNRRSALWQVSGSGRWRGAAPSAAGGGTSAHASHASHGGGEPQPAFADLEPWEVVGWDYQAGGLSATAHPLEPFREELKAQGLPDASGVASRPDGESISYAGMVICRQRPGTAGGVVFMTLEDESGFVNLVVWSKVFERYRTVILTQAFLGVSGTVQAREGVVHIVAERFWRPQLGARPTPTGSRDFR